MSLETDSMDEGNPFEDSPVTPNRLAGFLGAMDIGVFTLVGYMVFDNPLLGGLAGLFVGGGIFLFLPAFIAGSEADGGLEALESDAGGHPFRSLHRVAAGFALSAGGIGILSWAFVQESVPTALGVGVLIAAGLYIPLAFLVPNANV